MTESNLSSDFRPLSSSERKLLEKLLEPSFPGRDVLRAQLEFLYARALDDEGCLALQCVSGPPATVIFPVPVEGAGRDETGAPVSVLLQVFDGYMDSLVLASGTLAPARGLPLAETVRVLVARSENPGSAPIDVVPPLGLGNPPRK